ncbi:hypothetical protein E2C01_075493 [Portunus trituberculatus]|uniref:Uncharacterized protein n=1 Tax=Portunus trituberculatus TaxID=210409 RepID=A0A5B7IFY2_PORTR|nr:hypothetical protein [Portunus trituberculatus]
MQVDKTIVIGPEASQSQCCKIGKGVFKLSQLVRWCSDSQSVSPAREQSCPALSSCSALGLVEVVAVQDLPVADRQLCGMTGYCTIPRDPVMSRITVGGVEKLPAFVADMEEPCLVGLDSLVQSATCVDSGRMQMQVCEEMLPLILEVVREGEVADTTMRTHECQAVVRSCGGEVADATGTARGWQAVASNDSCEVDRDAGEVSPALSPHVADLEVCSSTKQTPKQVVKLEKWLMEHEDIFSQDAQDLGCTSLVQPSNMADNPSMKQPHGGVSLAKREEMRLPLDLATGRPPEEELPHKVVVTLQQRMEATQRQVANNRRLVGQAMTCWYQLRAGDSQYVVWDHCWQYKPHRKRGTTLKRLENYWERGKAIHCSATTCSCHRPHQLPV